MIHDDFSESNSSLWAHMVAGSFYVVRRPLLLLGRPWGWLGRVLLTVMSRAGTHLPE